MATKQTQLTKQQAENLNDSINDLREKTILFDKEYYIDELPKEVREALTDINLINSEIANYTRLVAILKISKNAVLKEIKELMQL